MTSSVQTALPKALPLPVPLTAAASRSPRSTQLKGAKGGGGGGAKGGGEGGGGIGSGGDDGGGGWPRRRRWRHRRRRRWWRRQWRNRRAAAQACQVPSVKLARGLSALRAYTIVYWRKHLKDEAQGRCIDKHTDENIKLYRNELRTKLS